MQNRLSLAIVQTEPDSDQSSLDNAHRNGTRLHGGTSVFERAYLVEVFPDEPRGVLERIRHWDSNLPDRLPSILKQMAFVTV